VVVEPGARSVQTYKKVRSLAADIGVRDIRVVANKIRDARDEAYLRERIPPDELLGFIGYDGDVIEADRDGVSPYDRSQKTVNEIRRIKERIDRADAA
jgi:CO dehydrogenase maturation factor